MPRIALLEDDARLAGMIRRALLNSGIATDIFSRISEAKYAFGKVEYAALILDRGLPDGDGLDFLRRLRSTNAMMPCLVLTARDGVYDRIDGLESGADDYLTKPFVMSEMVARVRTLLRRPLVLETLTATFADLEICPRQRTLSCNGKSVPLAAAELQVLLALVQARGHTVSHTRLEHAAWGLGEAVTPNALEVTVHRLRKKLCAVNAATTLINFRGAGFALRHP